MLRSRRQRSTNERETRTENGRSVHDAPLFRLGRVLLGGVLAFLALDNLRNREERVQYAAAKDAPRPEISVPAISGSLLLGSVGVMLWRYPVLAASAVASFFVGVTPMMHDFWNADDPQERQQETIQFMKNTALLGATFALLSLGRREQ